jgi:hypothetical protein
MNIITLQEARARGLKKYFTGVPCSNGHTTERSVAARRCLECIRESSSAKKDYRKQWLKENKDQNLATKRAHYQAHKEEYLERSEKQRKENPEQVRTWKREHRRTEKGKAQARRWYAGNSEAHLERCKDWKERNPGKVKEYVRARQAGLMTATPAWADRGAIQAIYEACPEGKWVDHVVPLNGDTVCGLHVDYNLQYLTPKENMAKGNKLLVTG